MDDYAVLTWRYGDPAPDGALTRARRALLQMDWSNRAQRPGLEVWAPREQAPPIYVSPGNNRVIIGRIFGLPDPLSNPEIEEGAQAFCRASWGRYAVVFRAVEGPAVAMLRDPSGAVEALSWTVEGLTVVASDTVALLEAIPPRDLAVDWRQLGWALADRIALAGACPLRGVLAVTPGALRWLDTGVEVAAWSPARFAARALADTPDTRHALRHTIDSTVAQLVTPGARVLAELSGGLDSSIVAGALVQVSDAAVAQWVHYYVEDSSGDERAYARAAAHQLGIDLTEVLKGRQGMGLDLLAAGASSVRPSGALGDPHYDLDLAERVVANGAGQIFTGLGGDTIFMQGGTTILAADDYWRRPRLGFGPAYEVARYAKRSVWSVWRTAQFARFRPDPVRHQPDVSHLAAGVAPPVPPPHPWLRDCRSVPPAKRRQLMHLTYQLLVLGKTARGSKAEIVNPLLAQPVVEMALSLSTRALTHGGDDRAMARETFRDRLAPTIYARRSKGDLGQHYGQETAQDLEAVRDLLLDGELINAGLLNPERLEAMLTPESLIWKGHYRAIMDMIVLEQWARSWRRRLSGLDAHQGAVQPA